ncbi:6-phosphogluconate dehydrogenase [Cristinia sonorae]|uniref:6-phosphogluconate dehydrogenase n=1 Tax=Cristinia sonorae TaxID=1940300 RepID=A0A8K0UL69_9AGAR|nr:6-phosphogluconate dehydrogenase [Cristinia sonorae]
MAAEPKDVLLIGLGAVGTIYAFVLQKSGLARVTVVARSNYEAVNVDGMHIKSLKYGEHKEWRPYRIFGSVQEAADRAYSHVVLVTKIIPELKTNPQLLEPLLSPAYTERFPQPVYVLMQNGMNIEVDLWNAIKALGQGSPKIIGTAVYIGSKQLVKNVVEHSDFDRVSMGIHREQPNVLTNSPEEEVILSEFGKLLETGGTEVTIVPDIHRVKYFKNAFNCLYGPVCALSRYSMQAIFRKPLDHWQGTAPEVNTLSEPGERTAAQQAVANVPASFPMVAEYTMPLMYEVLDEVKQLGNALFPDASEFDSDFAITVLTRTAVLVVRPESPEVPSMQVDVQLGRPMEIDVVVGSLVRAAKKVGVAMPRLETLYALLVIIQQHVLYEYRKKTSAA